MPTIPWKAFRRAVSDREFFALLSYLPLKSFWRVPAFGIYTIQVLKQLSSAQGMIGFSLRARPLAKKFWTLSAWESESAMRAFVQSPPHLKIMATLAPHMSSTEFLRWKVRGVDLPLKWEDALERFDAASRHT